MLGQKIRFESTTVEFNVSLHLNDADADADADADTDTEHSMRVCWLVVLCYCSRLHGRNQKIKNINSLGINPNADAAGWAVRIVIMVVTVC
jgi:hypothetical protein